MNFLEFTETIDDRIIDLWSGVIKELKHFGHNGMADELLDALNRGDGDLIEEITHEICDMEETDAFGTEGMRL